MKTTLSLAALLLVAGCASGPTLPLEEWSHGSALDHVGARPNPPLVMSDEQAKVFSLEVARLQTEAQSVRLKLANEPSRLRRMDQLRQLREIGDEMRPIERQLRDAGRPVPAPPPIGG